MGLGNRGATERRYSKQEEADGVYKVRKFGGKECIQISQHRNSWKYS